jgi:hypothetical protein
MKKRALYRLYTFLSEHENKCKFFDRFGILVQIALASICLSVLLRNNNAKKIIIIIIKIIKIIKFS